MAWPGGFFEPMAAIRDISSSADLRRRLSPSKPVRSIRLPLPVPCLASSIYYLDARRLESCWTL
jgi:hypothetical protein